jgi:hypothetical protein
LYKKATGLRDHQRLPFAFFLPSRLEFQGQREKSEHTVHFTAVKKVSQLLIQAFHRLFGRRPPERPRDPYAGSLVPNRRGPKDRSSAVALAEPDDE